MTDDRTQVRGREVARFPSAAGLVALLALACACARPPGASPPPHGDPPSAPPVAAAGTIAIAADARGFTPSTIALRQGAPAALAFRRTTAATCATAVVFPQLGIERPLPVGEDVVVPIPTDVPRVLAFQCGMGMYRSKVVVQ